MRSLRFTFLMLCSTLALCAQNARDVATWQDWPADGVTVSNATAAIETPGWLRLSVPSAPQTGATAGIAIQPAEGAWDFEAFAEIAVPVRNPGTEPVTVNLQIRDTGSLERLPNAHNRTYSMRAVLPASGETVWLLAPIGGKNKSPLEPRMISMMMPPREFVRHGVMDGASLARVEILIMNAREGERVDIGPVVARGTPEPWRDWPEERVFPLVDEYGQYRHRDWPGKIHSDADFAVRAKAEETCLAAHKRPAGWNKYGGWENGPKLRASGFFRVEKVDGRWWFVDPDGRLFWSHGVVRVATRMNVGGVYRGTPLPGREHMLTLPPRDSVFGRFYDTQSPSTRGHYLGKGRHEIYDYLEANLFRKHGANYLEAYRELAMRRLESWGLNTIANSSDPAIYLRRKTPYTAIVYSAPMGGTAFRVEGSGGDWGKLPDPFDPEWRRHMDNVLRTELKESLNDPWCIGFFVDNELKWGDSCHVAEAVLASPATQPAKRALVASILRKKYADIAALNTAWGVEHASWDALLESTTPPARARARADLEAMSGRFIDEYFAGCRAAIKAASPNHLYLGARFSHPSAFVARISARHSDVFSQNIYLPSLRDFSLPSGVDLPVLVGEFHFGALDRGLFCVGLVGVAGQGARALAYREYLASALKNPAVVGTHWFQFYDQPATGRFDGENYQAGLVDICDTPYPETIAAVRATAATLYQTRLGPAFGGEIPNPKNPNSKIPNSK